MNKKIYNTLKKESKKTKNPYLIILVLIIGAIPFILSYFGGVDNIYVSDIVDGDTIKVIYEGQEESLRLIGIDTPETKHPSIGEEPFGEEAYEFSQKKIIESGYTVRLKFDEEERDKYGRLLAYVYLDDDTMLNNELVLEGLASVSTYPPNEMYEGLFMASELEAQIKGLNIWE